MFKRKFFRRNGIRVLIAPVTSFMFFLLLACSVSAQETGSGSDSISQITVDSVRVIITPIVEDSIYQVIEAAYYNDGSSNVRRHAPQSKKNIVRFYRESLTLINSQIENLDSRGAGLIDARKKLLEQRKVYRAELQKLKNE